MTTLGRTRNIRGYGRGIRAETYVEPKLYAIIKMAAEEEQTTISTWLRGLIFDELMIRGKIDKDTLAELAGR